MASELMFDVRWESGLEGDALDAASYASLRMAAGDHVLTTIQDELARTTREVVRAPVYPLALWFVSNWWRLRWEGQRSSSDWALTHRLAAVGQGWVWPNLTLFSDGESIHLELRASESAPFEPISYLRAVRATLAAEAFERAVGGFVETVAARLAACGYPQTHLAELWQTVQTERKDDATAHLRRLEALLGFDAEEAPGELLASYEKGEKLFGRSATAEVAAVADGVGAPDWGAISSDLQQGDRIRIADFRGVQSAATSAAQGLPRGWQRGEKAARAVRAVLGKPRGPLSDDVLQSWLGLGGYAARASWSFGYGGRDQADPDSLTLCFHSKHKPGQRFELGRFLGDHLICADPGDSLLPVTRARTARQREQRAFSAELLLPMDDLLDEVGGTPDDDAMEAVADKYAVSPLLVRTRLVAKGVMGSEILDVPM